jgi:hypothetical protein
MASNWSARLDSILLALLACLWLASALVLPSFPSTNLWLDLVFASVSFWPVLVLWAIVPVVALVLAIKRLRGGNFGRAVAWLSLPAALVLFIFKGPVIGDAAQFWLNKRAYDRAVADAHAGKCAADDRRSWGVEIDGADCREPVTIIFAWGGFLSTWHGVVYDAADQIAKPPEERSGAWRNRDIGELLACSRVSFAFGNHYYRASGNYC